MGYVLIAAISFAVGAYFRKKNLLVKTWKGVCLFALTPLVLLGLLAESRQARPGPRQQSGQPNASGKSTVVDAAAQKREAYALTMSRDFKKEGYDDVSFSAYGDRKETLRVKSPLFKYGSNRREWASMIGGKKLKTGLCNMGFDSISLREDKIIDPNEDVYSLGCTEPGSNK